MEPIVLKPLMRWNRPRSTRLHQIRSDNIQPPVRPLIYGDVPSVAVILT